MAVFTFSDMLKTNHRYLNDLLDNIKTRKRISIIKDKKKISDVIIYSKELKELHKRTNDPKYLEKTLKIRNKNVPIFKSKTDEYTISQIDKSPYSGSGGSGAGAKITKLAESAVALATAYKVQYNKNLNLNDTKNIMNLKKVVDLGQTTTEKEIKEIIDFLNNNSDWYSTTVNTADILVKNLKITKKHHFHRDSIFMNSIYKRFSENLKKINTLGIRIDGNKWNPSDIWISDKDKFPATNDLPSVDKLNKYLLDNFKESNIVGVSLKKLGKSPVIKTYNLGKQEISFQFKEVRKVKSPFSSGDMYIETEDGSTIQIRSFNVKQNVQAELKGKHANQGKIGFGNIMFLLNKLAKTQIHNYKEIERKPETKIIDDIYKFYQDLGYNFSKKELLNEFLAKDFSKKPQKEFLIGKYQALEIVAGIAKSKQRDTICTAIFAYASSLGLKGLFDASVYDKIS